MEITGVKKLDRDINDVNRLLTKIDRIEIPSDVSELITDIGLVKQKNIEQDNSINKINEQLGEKVNYTDLTPIVTTGEASAYIATIPSTLTEVTIVPHVDNLEGATLNGKTIKGRDGKPIRAKVLKANIPIKLVGIGNDFFIVNGEGGGALELEGAYTVSLGTAPTYGVLGNSFYNDILVETPSLNSSANVCKYSKSKKGHEVLTTLNLKTISNLQGTINIKNIAFSKEGSKVYFELTSTVDYTVVKYGIYEVDLTTYMYRTIVESSSSAPKMIYADKDYIYYHAYNGTRNEYNKLSTVDLSKVSTNPGNMYSSTNSANNRYMFYCESNNCVYIVSSDGGYATDLQEINLTTLTMTVKTLGSSSVYTTNKKGLFVDGTYLYAITDTGSSNTASLSKYNLADFSLVSSIKNVTTLSNPKAFKVGQYFQEIVFYDKKNNLLWVNTSDSYDTGSSINYPQAILIALDLNKNYEICDIVYLKNKGSTGSTNNTFGGLQVRDSMFTSLYGDKTVICDVDNNLYYQVIS